MVLIPRLEYRTQITFLDRKECDHIVTSFRQIFKHKLHYASTAPNAFMDNEYIYNIINFYNRWLAAQISNFVIQINDNNLLGKITKLRLK